MATLLTGTVTPASFATALLSYLGLPTNQANVDAVVAWENQEGGNWKNTAAYNPLNTTLQMPGSTSQNKVGVQAYTSWDQGLAATAQTLEQTNMTPIRQALATGGGCQGLADAGPGTPWGTNWSSVAKLCGVSYNPASTAAGTSTSTCAIGNFLGGCLLTTGQVNTLVGGFKVAAGGLIMGFGLILAVSAAFGSKAGRAAVAATGPVGTVAEKTPVVGQQARTGRTQQRTQRAAAEQKAGRQRESDVYTRERRTQTLRQGDERIRTQQAMTQGRNDSADIDDYQREEKAEAKRNRQTPQERRRRNAQATGGGIPNPAAYRAD